MVEDWNDKDFVMQKVKEDGINLEYASEELRNDRELVLTAVSQDVGIFVLRYVSEELRNDREIVLKAIDSSEYAFLSDATSEYPDDTSKYISKDLLNDKEIVLKLVKAGGEILIYVGEKMKNDKEVVLEAIRNSKGYSVDGLLSFASEELRSNKEFVLEVVNINGRELEGASEELRNDREVVLEAVKTDGFALGFASEELRNDREIVLKAIEGEKDKYQILKYTNENLRNEYMLKYMSEEELQEVIEHNDWIIKTNEEDLKKSNMIKRIIEQQKKIKEQEAEIAKLKGEHDKDEK